MSENFNKVQAVDSAKNLSEESPEKQFHQGVAEPDNPDEFMLKILGKTKDDAYETYPQDQIPPGETLDSLRAKLPERREKMQSTLLHMSQIARLMAETYREVCHRNEMDPGKISIYIVGGRVREKPLQHSSDIDVVFTVENESQGLQPNFSLDSDGDSTELIRLKTAARKQFVNALEGGFRDMDLLEKDDKGEEVGWFIEPKGYGRSDTKERKDWADATASAGEKQIAVRIYTG